MPPKINLTGRTFDRLTVIEEAGRNAHGNVLWLCQCSCGKEVQANGSKLKTGKTKSCGCGSPWTKTHGQSQTRLYIRYRSMVARTTDPKNRMYADYGGRGITVCPRWLEPDGRGLTNFVADMEPTFREELQLDRIDNDGPYSPENCRWVTASRNSRNKRNNRRLSLWGQTKSLAEWSELLGLTQQAIRSRLDRRGWSVQRALTTGVDSHVLAWIRPNADQDSAP
jgi:hypothetical protein